MDKYHPFDLSKLSDSHRLLVTDALDKTDFNFKLLIPGLISQVDRDTIPVLFSDLSRYQVKLDEERDHTHIHAHPHDGTHEAPHTIVRVVEGRKRVLGLAWYSGKVEVERTCPPALAQEVFLAEAAHMVDFFYMTPRMREDIFKIYHGGNIDDHDHGWFEETGNNDYWSWVGESFMYGFISAFSKIKSSGDSFIHRTTAEIGKQIYEVFNPRKKVARNLKSSIVHKMNGWHERQIPDTLQQNFPSLDSAIAHGFRKCKTCRWE